MIPEGCLPQGIKYKTQNVILLHVKSIPLNDVDIMVMFCLALVLEFQMWLICLYSPGFLNRHMANHVIATVSVRSL